MKLRQNIPLLLTGLLLICPPKLYAEQDELARRLKHAATDIAPDYTEQFEAWVWLTDMSKRLEYYLDDRAHRVTLLKTVYQEAKRVGVAPELILAIIHVESLFKPYAISSAGARGLMQVMPFWLKEIGQPTDNLFDIKTNLRYGCTILRYYLDKEQGDTLRALARYNGSFGKKDYPEKVYRLWQNKWFNQ